MATDFYQASASMFWQKSNRLDLWFCKIKKKLVKGCGCDSLQGGERWVEYEGKVPLLVWTKSIGWDPVGGDEAM